MEIQCWLFELLIRVSRTTVSPSRCLIWQVNQCLRPCVSIYRRHCADRAYPYKSSQPLCLGTILHGEKRVFIVRSWLLRATLTAPSARRGGPADLHAHLSVAVGGQPHRQVVGKLCGIYRLALIYARTTVPSNLPKAAE